MPFRWSKKRVIWTVLLTVVATLLVAALAMNFATPEKKLEQKVEFRHPVSDPQFRREQVRSFLETLKAYEVSEVAR